MIYINPNRRTDVYYGVTEKLYEWFGYVESITCHKCGDYVKQYDIYFDGRCVGTLKDLIDGISKLFFDERDTKVNISVFVKELKSLMESGEAITIDSIARVIIASKVNFKQPRKNLCRKLRRNIRYESTCLKTQWEM